MMPLKSIGRYELAQIKKSHQIGAGEPPAGPFIAESAPNTSNQIHFNPVQTQRNANRAFSPIAKSNSIGWPKITKNGKDTLTVIANKKVEV